MTRWILFFALLGLCFALVLFLSNTRNSYITKRINQKHPRHNPPKPLWVKRELIRIKAHIPSAGCRHICDIFNRRFAKEKDVTVGKTFVYETLKKHFYEVEKLRRKWKSRIPKPLAQNVIWGMDITGITDSNQNTQNILGILDHGTRKSISLLALKDKASISLIRLLLNVIETYGKPKAIRTDNEAIFNSRLFHFGLWVLGIKHQRTMPHCPWQNGRIERFFWTFKHYADRVIFNAKYLQNALDDFAFWYNAIRPHRHLEGKTPNEVWNNVDPYAQAPKSCKKFSAWNGMLRGYRMEYG